MANKTDQYGNPILIQPNNYAETVFGLNTQAYNATANNYAGAPRPRFLFLVRFVRASGAGGQAWSNGMTFAVRSADRPKIQPQVQELNQYNKKRLVQTGVKYSPVKVSFYDTTDAAVMQMWNEYSNFYFGDFRQSGVSNWAYDVTAPQFVGGQAGFGFSPNLSTDVVKNINTTAYFFDRIEVYQVYAGEYSQFTLVNPKISSFDPDGFDYEHSEAHTIDMSFEYEAVLYANGGMPASIASNSTLAPLFKSLPNQAYDPFTIPGYTPGVDAPGNNYAQQPTGGLSSLLGLATTLLSPGGTGAVSSAAKTIGSGVLGAFGTAVFGQNNPLSNTFAGALPSIMNGSFNGANTVNALLRNTASNPNAALSAMTNIGSNSIPAQTYSQSLGAISKFLSPSAPSSTAQGLAAAVTASSVATGSAPSSQMSSTSSNTYGFTSGLNLSTTAMGVYNQNSSSGAQIGQFTTSTNTGGNTPDSDSLIV
jgi:hypothetical protein